MVSSFMTVFRVQPLFDRLVGSSTRNTIKNMTRPYSTFLHALQNNSLNPIDKLGAFQPFDLLHSNLRRGATGGTTVVEARNRSII